MWEQILKVAPYTAEIMVFAFAGNQKYLHLKNHTVFAFKYSEKYLTPSLIVQ